MFLYIWLKCIQTVCWVYILGFMCMFVCSFCDVSHQGNLRLELHSDIHKYHSGKYVYKKQGWYIACSVCCLSIQSTGSFRCVDVSSDWLYGMGWNWCICGRIVGGCSSSNSDGSYAEWQPPLRLKHFHIIYGAVPAVGKESTANVFIYSNCIIEHIHTMKKHR